MKAKIKDKDNGLKKLIGFARRIGLDPDREITIGVHSDEGGAYSGVTIQDIASFHEFGTATIPSRSFLRGWYDNNLARNRALMKRALEHGVKTYNLERPIKQLSLVFVGDIQKRMVAGIPPPLVYRDGTPLIDTGQLKGAIRAKVDGVKV